VITQNGKPAMVVQSVHEYEHTQETLAMFKMLVQSEHVIAHGTTILAYDVITKLRRRQSL
jgi:PHD/YefM family antitoxin component YafN of YafNO toxin-antitoxin module